MEAFCVVLDTNVWRSELLLNTPNGAALLFLVKRCNARIGLPEIVEQEIGKVLVRECLKAAKPLKTLGPLIGFELGADATEEAFAARVTKRLSDLASLFRRLPFTHEHARGALERIIQKLPPNGPDREQFRDSAIWEAVLECARTEAVHFVTEDKDFFCHREPKNGPAENIEAEAKRQAHRIRVHPSLPLCLSTLQEIDPTVDKEGVAQAIESALRGELSASAVNKGFAIERVIHRTVTPFFTEQTGALAVDFELTFDVENLADETREDARVVSSGSCFFQVSTKSISDVRRRLEEFSWRDRQGLPQKRKHYCSRRRRHWCSAVKNPLRLIRFERRSRNPRCDNRVLPVRGLSGNALPQKEAKKMKGDYAYKCECGRLIKIDDEYEDFFVGHGEGMRRSFLVGTCPECGRDSLFTPDDFGKLYHVYTGARFEFR